MHTASAIGTALLGENGSLLLQAEAVGGVWFFCFVLLVQGFFCGGFDSLDPFLPFVVLQCLAAGKGNVFAFKIRARRKVSLLMR